MAPNPKSDFKLAIGSTGIAQANAINNLVDRFRYLPARLTYKRLNILNALKDMASADPSPGHSARLYVSISTLTRPVFLKSYPEELQERIKDIAASLYAVVRDSKKTQQYVWDPRLRETDLAIRGDYNIYVS